MRNKIGKATKTFLLNLPIGIIVCILVTGLCIGSARAEKYINASGETVEMPKGMKPPPKQTWDNTPYKLPTTAGGKATPVTNTTKQSQPVKQQTTKPVVQPSSKNTQPQPSPTPGTVRRPVSQHQSISPRPYQRIESKESPARTVFKKSRPVIAQPSVNKPKTTKAKSDSKRETPSVTPYSTTSPEQPPPDKDKIPDTTLPLAAGAAAGMAALGALGVAFAQGIRPMEAVGELVGLFRGEFEPSSPEIVDAVSLEKEKLEAEKYKKAYDDLINERRQHEYTSEDTSIKSLVDHAKEEVQQQYELEKNSTWGALDQISIEDLIADKAPGKEARDAMLNIVKSYTDTTLRDGTVVVNRKAMLNDISNYLADANRLDKSQFTADEIDSAFLEALDQVKETNKPLENAAMTSTAYGSIKDNIDLLKDLQKTSAYTNNPQAKKALEFFLGQTESFQKLDEQGMSIVGDAAKWSNHVVEFGEYYKAYQRTGLNNDEALNRALTRKAVDIAVEQGVDTLQNKCPVVKAANYFYDYGVKTITGKDYGLKTSLNCLGQRAANYAYGDYETALPDLKLDSNTIREANIEQVGKLLEVSSGSQKQQLQDMYNILKAKGSS